MKVGIVGNMTKLEQKLIELGYKSYYNSLNSEHQRYCKQFSNVIEMNITIKYSKITISNVEYFSHLFYKQQDIDNLQQAFNQLQSDLKELKEYEENI